MDQHINKKKFTHLLYQRVEQLSYDRKFTKKDAEFFTDRFLETCIDSLQQGHKVFFSGFGYWHVKQRNASVKSNPKDANQKVHIPQKKVLKFKPSNKLNDLLN